MRTEAEMDPEEKDAISTAWHHRARLSEIVASTSLTLARLEAIAVGVQTSTFVVGLVSFTALLIFNFSFLSLKGELAYTLKTPMVRWIAAAIFVVAVLSAMYLWARLRTLRRVTEFGRQQIQDSEKILSNIDRELLDVPAGAPGYYGKEGA